MTLGIDAATWARVSPLLDEALDLPEAERAGWLARLPPVDEALRPVLERLLAEPAPALHTLSPLAAWDAGHAAGERVGPYRLLHSLGIGGMGEVWLAERADGLMQRQVALKLPHASAVAGDLALRMARERNILAALVHPNIARLYDAGIAEDGQPYLALELVRGERIDLYADRHALDVPARLKLALQAARAVAHAHAQLVVHRDIKPSNLLVDGDGQVKLLDFGIAKLLDRDAGSDLTERGAKPMTPGYASPEQLAGQPVGTRSDVYSLGVVLYELLAGASPYGAARKTPAALEAAVLRDEARRPSEVAAERRRRKALRGDLDTIVQHALRKRPEDRYATVDALADDIERHLAHRPLQAQPDSRWRVLKKLVRRNRIAFGAGSAIATALLAGTAVALWQAQVARAERERAEQVKGFIVAILRDASPYQGRDVAHLTAVDLVHQADERLQAAAIAAPAVRAELGALIGESLFTLGDVDGAEPVLRRTAADARRELGDDHFLSLRARLLAAQVQRFRGRPELQQQELLAVLGPIRARAVADPDSLVETLAHLALNAIDRGAYDEAEQFALEGYGLARRALGERHVGTAAASVVLGMAHRYRGHFAEARAVGEQALRITRAAYPGPLHPRVVEAMAVYGRALADAGEIAAGIAQIEQAAQGARALFGPDSPLAGTTRQNLVAYQIDLGQLDAAVESGRESLRVIALHAQPDSYNHAATAASCGIALLAARRAEEAAALLAPAAATLARLLGAGHDTAVFAAANAALADAYAGRLDAARQRIEALAEPAKGAGVKPPTRARLRFARGVIQRLGGDSAAALAELQSLLADPDPAPRLQRERMRSRVETGLALLALGRPAEAAPAFEAALAEMDRLEAAPTPARAEAIAGLARARHP